MGESAKALHEALSTLGPATPSTLPLPSQSASAPDLSSHIHTSLTHAKTIIDSLPTSSSATASTKCSDWKSQNAGSGKPFELWKLSAKDGGGTWFARRSVVRGIKFERFKRGLQLEFGNGEEEGEDGEGEAKKKEKKESVRGIGIDRLVEKLECKDGMINIYHLKAQFPGPSAPRDFVTCCIASNAPHPGQTPEECPKHYYMISRPVREHPETGNQKPGFVRGEYESVEFIRELPRGYRDPNNKTATANKNNLTVEDDTIPPIEWVMVTRSNPGGNVPRWMVERGTPGSIVQDAEKFLNWVSSSKPELKTPRQSESMDRPMSMNEEETVPLEAVAEGKSTEELAGEDDAPPKGEYSSVVGSILETMKTGVEVVASGVANVVVAGHKTGGTNSPARPSMDRFQTGDSGRSFATAYSSVATPRDASSPTRGSPTPTSSMLSLDTKVVAAISAEEQKALEKHLEYEEKIKTRITKALEAVAKEKEENGAQLSQIQQTRSIDTASYADSSKVDISSDEPPSKEQKKAIKTQWKLKERKKKLEEKLTRELKREEQRYEKEVEKIKHRLMKQAQKDKERELAKEAKEEKERKKEAENDVTIPQTPLTGSGESKGLDLAAAGKKMEEVMNGTIRSASQASKHRKRGEWAKARENELRSLVEQLTMEIISLRKANADLQDEVERLKAEKSGGGGEGEDSGTDVGGSEYEKTVEKAKRALGKERDGEVPTVNSLV